MKKISMAVEISLAAVFAGAAVMSFSAGLVAGGVVVDKHWKDRLRNLANELQEVADQAMDKLDQEKDSE